MSIQQAKKTTASIYLERLQQLDWEPIAYKLIYPEVGRCWSKAQTEQAIAQYMMFLALKQLEPKAAIVPSQIIDRVWHTHILDTQKYAADCQKVFGSFLHHFPYFGIRSQADKHNLTEAFVNTQCLFEKHFGVSLTGECDKPGICVLQSQSVLEPSICLQHSDSTRHPSICVLQTSTDQYRPRIQLDLNTFIPAKV